MQDAVAQAEAMVASAPEEDKETADAQLATARAALATAEVKAADTLKPIQDAWARAGAAVIADPLEAQAAAHADLATARTALAATEEKAVAELIQGQRLRPQDTVYSNPVHMDDGVPNSQPLKRILKWHSRRIRFIT